MMLVMIIFIFELGRSGAPDLAARAGEIYTRGRRSSRAANR